MIQTQIHLLQRTTVNKCQGSVDLLTCASSLMWCATIAHLLPFDVSVKALLSSNWTKHAEFGCPFTWGVEKNLWFWRRVERGKKMCWLFTQPSLQATGAASWETRRYFSACSQNSGDYRLFHPPPPRVIYKRIMLKYILEPNQSVGKVKKPGRAYG